LRHLRCRLMQEIGGGHLAGRRHAAKAVPISQLQLDTTALPATVGYGAETRLDFIGNDGRQLLLGGFRIAEIGSRPLPIGAYASVSASERASLIGFRRQLRKVLLPVIISTEATMPGMIGVRRAVARKFGLLGLHLHEIMGLPSSFSTRLSAKMLSTMPSRPPKIEKSWAVTLTTAVWQRRTTATSRGEIFASFVKVSAVCKIPAITRPRST
jgi:hypothetical protein